MRAFEETGDCYQVKELEPEQLYEVKHYPDRETRRPCCRVKVRVTDADRAKSIPDADPHGVAAALARCERAIEKKHAGVVVDKNTASK